MQHLARQWTTVQPAVAAFITSLVPHHHDAEEILQRTAAALVAKFDDYDGGRPFINWAMGVARIEALRHRDARRRERAVFTFDTDTVEAVARAFTRRGSEAAAMRAAIDACVDRLQGKVREIFRLTHVEELSIPDVAARLGRTPNAVTVALHRGRTAVRDCLRTRYAFEEGAAEL